MQLTPRRKAVLLRIGIGFAVLLALTALAIFVGHKFFTPNQHSPARYGTVQIRLGPGWSADERARMGAEFHLLNRLGPKFEWAPAGDASPPSPPGPKETSFVRRVVVYRGDWGPERCTTPGFGAGYYDTVTMVVWIDPVCAPGEGLAATLAHEIGHSIGMRHICRSAGDTTADCAPGVYDPASLMNPGLPEFSGGAFVPPLAPSYQDLAEFNRAIRQR